MTWCDCCGDLTKAWKPIDVRFPDGTEITINICLECWDRDFEESRKLKVARLLEILRRD